MSKRLDISVSGGVVVAIVGLLVAVIISLFSQNWMFMVGTLTGFGVVAVAVAVDKL
jgi:hypothetical protein